MVVALVVGSGEVVVVVGDRGVLGVPGDQILPAKTGLGVIFILDEQNPLEGAGIHHPIVDVRILNVNVVNKDLVLVCVNAVLGDVVFLGGERCREDGGLPIHSHLVHQTEQLLPIRVVVHDEGIEYTTQLMLDSSPQLLRNALLDLDVSSNGTDRSLPKLLASADLGQQVYDVLTISCKFVPSVPSRQCVQIRLNVLGDARLPHLHPLQLKDFIFALPGVLRQVPEVVLRGGHLRAQRRDVLLVLPDIRHPLLVLPVPLLRALGPQFRYF